MRSSARLLNGGKPATERCVHQNRRPGCVVAGLLRDQRVENIDARPVGLARGSILKLVRHYAVENQDELFDLANDPLIRVSRAIRCLWRRAHASPKSTAPPVTARAPR